MLFLNRSDCVHFIVGLVLGNAYTGLSSSCSTESIVLCPPEMGDVLFFQALSHKRSPFSFFLFLNTTAHSLLAQRGNSFKREAPGQFPLPSFAACHVVYSAQLFKKC